MNRTNSSSALGTRMFRCIVLALVAAAGSVGCGRTTEPVERVRIALAVAPGTVAPGDTVEFTSTAFNPTAARVQLGTECGPSFDVMVTAPDGRTVSVLGELLGPTGASTCVLAPYHFADPGATQTLRLRWRVPAQGGIYRAVTGLRRSGSGLAVRSAPVEFVVR